MHERVGQGTLSQTRRRGSGEVTSHTSTTSGLGQVCSPHTPASVLTTLLLGPPPEASLWHSRQLISIGTTARNVIAACLLLSGTPSSIAHL